MTEYKEILNEETGAVEFQFNAKLIQIGQKVLQNSNEKKFKVVTLGFNLPGGKAVERSAICYESNYQHGIEEGRSYLSNLSFDEEGNPQLRMSHLLSAERANKEEFAGLLSASKQVIEEELVM